MILPTHPPTYLSSIECLHWMNLLGKSLYCVKLSNLQFTCLFYIFLFATSVWRLVGADRRVISFNFGPKLEPGSGKDRDTGISVFRCLDAGPGEVIISQLLTAGMLPPLATSASKSSIRRFVITERAPTRAFSWLKAATTAFTFKTLLRHYAIRALTPWSLNVKLGPRRNYQLSWGTGGYKTLC